MGNLEKLISDISDIIWGYPLLILLFGTHIFLTFRLRFIQKYTGKAIKISLKRSKEGEGDVSQFGALTTALAATIGTGNIVGVSTAIAAGGPMYVLEKGMKKKWLAILFAALMAFSAFGIGNMVQANSVAEGFEFFNIPRWISGLILAKW